MKKILHFFLSLEQSRMGRVITAVWSQRINECYQSYKPLNLRDYEQDGKPMSNENKETVQDSP